MSKERTLTQEERIEKESLTPNEIKRVLVKNFEAVKKGHRVIPICLCGNPGIGKSQIVQQAAQESGADMYEVRVALAVDSSDFTGLPVIDRHVASDGKLYDSRTVYSRPELLPFMPKDENGNYISDDKLRVIFFDEVNRGADPSITNAIFQLLTEYKLGTHKLYPNTAIVLAINPENTGYMVNEMCPALVNRQAFLYIKPDLAQWIAYANVNSIDPNITSFVSTFPKFFSESGVSEEEGADKRFPTPRAWFNVDSILQAHQYDWADPADATLAAKVISGIIGFAAATAFVNFCKTQVDDRLIPGEKIIRQYDTDTTLKAKVTSLDKNGNRAYDNTKALQTANLAMEELVSALDRDATAQHVKNFFTFLLDIDSEIAATIINTLTKEYTDWLTWCTNEYISQDKDISDLWFQVKGAGKTMGLGASKSLGARK